jgi:hypothetical protein
MFETTNLVLGSKHATTRPLRVNRSKVSHVSTDDELTMALTPQCQAVAAENRQM